jgi:hypothetical protein
MEEEEGSWGVVGTTGHTLHHGGMTKKQVSQKRAQELRD